MRSHSQGARRSHDKKYVALGFRPLMVHHRYRTASFGPRRSKMAKNPESIDPNCRERCPNGPNHLTFGLVWPHAMVR